MRSLDDLRQEIDRLDAEMHRLLIQRTKVVEEVGAFKRASSAGSGTGTPFFRPGREAEVIRRLIARHDGPFPPLSLVRIWREIINGSLQVETPVSLAVHAGTADSDLGTLAVNHFGAGPRMVRCQRAMQVIAHVRDVQAAIGILPMPDSGVDEVWWPHLARSEPGTPRIVGCLPFARRDQDGSASALVIASLFPEATGDDHGFVAVEHDPGTSVSSLTQMAARAGFSPVRAFGGGRDHPHLHMFELGEMVLPDDPRLTALQQDPGRRILAAVPLGGHAVPITLPRTVPAGSPAAEESL